MYSLTTLGGAALESRLPAWLATQSPAIDGLPDRTSDVHPHSRSRRPLQTAVGTVLCPRDRFADDPKNSRQQLSPEAVLRAVMGRQ
jgi:hypothetical protein